MRIVNTDGKTVDKRQSEEEDIRNYYNQADAFEDAILFPEEVSKNNHVARFEGKTNDLEKFVSSGPDVSAIFCVLFHQP